VGFGGGSSYIAILVISGVSIVTVPTIALPLNIAVSGIAFFNYLRAGHFSLKFSLPFLASIPFAFYAGTLNFDESTLAIVFVNACPAKPLIEFVRMKKLAVAAACFGIAKRDNIKSGDNHIPPPTPTSPEIEPMTAPIGVPIIVSFLELILRLLICCSLFFMV